MSTSDNTATKKRDVYARVTAQIITAIEQGVGNWRMPLAHQPTLCFLADQRQQQEAIGRRLAGMANGEAMERYLVEHHSLAVEASLDSS